MCRTSVSAMALAGALILLPACAQAFAQNEETVAGEASEAAAPAAEGFPAPASRTPARVGGDDAPIATVKRDEPKIGRNDPCWCGSGKKYKKCHGAN